MGIIVHRERGSRLQEWTCMNNKITSLARIAFVAVFILPQRVIAVELAAESRYEIREQHDPNGIGKFYMGREIAHVMGHEAADWLERPDREEEEQPTKAIGALDLKPGMVVADIGAGTGYFSFRMSPLVGPKGKVLAVDIQQEMLDLLAAP